MKAHEPTNPHDAAFGHAAENGHCCGLTKRELFAAMALQGMLSNPEIGMPGAVVTDNQTEQQQYVQSVIANEDVLYSETAKVAVEHADALIAALNAEDKG